MDVGSCSASSLPELHTKSHKTLVPSDKWNHWNGMRCFVSLTLVWSFKVFDVQKMLRVGTPDQFAECSQVLRCFTSPAYLYFEIIRLTGHTESVGPNAHMYPVKGIQ